MKTFTKKKGIIMNGLRNTLTVLSVMVLPMVAIAQENINKAIENFGTDVSRNGIKMTSVEKDNTKAYVNTYKFSLPKKNADKINPLKKAFYQDASDAYEVFTKDEMDKSKKNMRIAYGDKLEKTINVGWPYVKTGKNCMVMLFNDKEDDKYRYAYMLEWEKSGKKLEGTVMKIYSLNPKKLKSVKKKTFDGTYLLIGDSLKTSTLNELGFERNGDRVVLKSDGGTIVVGKDGVYMDDGQGNTTVVGDGIKSYSTDVAADPITKFSNLRASYMSNIREGNIDNTTLLTGLANYILKFCKTYGKQMSADERQLCIEGLQEMQEQTPDKYIKGIFGLAIKSMR